MPSDDHKFSDKHSVCTVIIEMVALFVILMERPMSTES